MTQNQPKDLNGFTTVELLVTLVIGVLFIATGYQLFMIITKDGAENRDRALAANIASSELNRQIARKDTCTTTAATFQPLPTPADTTLADPEVTGKVSWPYGCSGQNIVKRVDVKVTYGEAGSRKEVNHVRYVES